MQESFRALHKENRMGTVQWKRRIIRTIKRENGDFMCKRQEILQRISMRTRGSILVNQSEKIRPVRFISQHHRVSLQNSNLFLKLAH